MAGQDLLGPDFNAVKLENLKRNPWVALVADEYKESWRNIGGVMAQGKAKTYTKGPVFLRARTLLYRKFPPYKKYASFEECETTIVEVTPEKLISWWF